MSERPWLSIAAFALAAGTFFGGLGALPLMQPDEGRNAVIALEMQREGAWLLPSILGFPYLDKPAFFFKLSGLSLDAFGRHEAAARLPSALFAMAVAALLYAFVKREAGPRRAALSVAVLATLPLFVAFARLVIFDMTLTAFVSAAILAGHLGERAEGATRRRWLVAAAVCGGFGTLVKGPVGAFVPLVVHVAAARWNGNRGVLRRALGIAPIGAWLAVVLPWLFAVSRQAPDFLEYGVLIESAKRLTSPEFLRNEPIWYYLPLLFAGCLPWSLLFPPAAWLAWRHRARLGPLDRLAIVWVVGIAALFTLSQSKQPAYVLPACVGVALGLGRFLEAALARPEGIVGRAVWAALGLLAVPFALLALALGGLLESPALLDRLPPMKPPPAFWQDVFPAVAGVSAAFAVVVTVARLRQRLGVALVALALLLPALLVAGAPAFLRYAERRSSRVLAARFPAIPPETQIVCLRTFPSSLPFYLDHSFVLVSDDVSELRSNYVPWALTRGAERPPALLHPDELAGWLASRSTPVYLLTSKAMRRTLDALAASRGVAVTELAPEQWGAFFEPASGS